MKQKIKCEIEIEADQEMEFVRHQRHQFSPLFKLSDSEHFAQDHVLIFRPVEPPLELETETFIGGCYNILNVHLNQKGDLNIPIILKCYPEARDLAKILNYWAEHGKLPKVTLKQQ